MTVLFSIREKVSQRENWDSNMHLSQLLASAVRCDSEDTLVELRRCKTSLIKLNPEAGT